MIRCEVCEGMLRMRASGVWVHVDRNGNALPGETVWPRDHEPKPHADVYHISVEFTPSPEIRWGDGLEFDRAWWVQRMNTPERKRL